MNILDKYLIREIFRYFFMVLILVIIIYLAIDFFEKIDSFMESGLPFSRIIEFFLHTIPFVMSQILPVGVLMSVLISIGLMNKHNELLAFRSCGVSVYQMIKPVLATGFFFTLVLFFLSEVIVPVTMATANRIWLVEVRKEQAVATRENNIWLKSSHGILHIRHYNAAENTLYKVTVNTFDDQFRLIRRIDADRGVFLQGQWVLYEILEQTLDETGTSYTITYHDSMPVQIDMNPERLRQVSRKSSEMDIKALLDYINTIKDEGYSTTQLWVDFHAKIAFPFVCVILVLVGMGIACKRQLKDGLPAGIAFGIGIAFLYWVLHSFCISLGYGDMLPPVIAAWATNGIFLCLGVLLLIQAEHF